jgi:hypothetical protein
MGALQREPEILSDDAKSQAGQRAEEQACQHNRGISWDRNVAAEFGPITTPLAMQAATKAMDPR